jgi:hypothetical protein
VVGGASGSSGDQGQRSNRIRRGDTWVRPGIAHWLAEEMKRQEMEWEKTGIWEDDAPLKRSPALRRSPRIILVAAQGACSATVPAASDEAQGDVSAVRNTAALRRAHARRSTKALEDGVPGRVGSREVQNDIQGQPSPSACDSDTRSRPMRCDHI